MGYGGSRRLPLFFLSFSAQLTMDMIAMTAPLLALSLSASPFEIGLLATSKGIVYGILPFAMGHLSDRAERRSLLASSMSIYAIVAILFYLSKSPIELIALRFFEGLAMAIFWPTIEPLFAEARDIDISKSLRGFNLSWGLGQIVGPFLGGVLITAFGARSPFLLALFMAIMNLILISRLAPTKPALGIRELGRSAKGGLPISLVLTNAILGAILSIFFAFFPAFGVRAGFSALEVGSLLLLFGITRLAFFHMAPSIRIGLEPRIGLASLGLVLIHIDDRAAIYSGVVLSSAAASLIYAYSIERMLRAEEGRLGRMAGIFEGSLGIGFVLGPLLAGPFAGPRFSMAFVVASLLGVILILALELRRRLGRMSD
ncbi:MAG: MFS transporter [Candidatus Bathyarchaeia archaeon]